MVTMLLTRRIIRMQTTLRSVCTAQLGRYMPRPDVLLWVSWLCLFLVLRPSEPPLQGFK